MEEKPKYKTAIGLKYGGVKDETPSINVKGDNLLADEVVRIAKRFGIPVIEKPELARALSALEVDSEIPEKLFEAVALLLLEIEKKDKADPAAASATRKIIDPR